MFKHIAASFTFFRVVVALLVLAAALTAYGWITGEDPAEKPFLVITGGGFVVNYRISEIFYGFSVTVQKPVRVSSIIEAQFENPAGGEPLVEQVRLNARTKNYSLRSPAVKGVKADVPYEVVISLYDYSGKNLIERQIKHFKSSVDGTIVPEEPLTIGPGYHLNPDRDPPNNAAN
ncbi:MAG: hypothetical protein ACR2O0_12625 [Rhizobiaceae bacterium]